MTFPYSSAYYQSRYKEKQPRKRLKMAKILAVATHATDDPTRSTLAFVTVAGALGAGKEVGIALLGEAVYLVKEAVAKSVRGVGFPPLPELIEKVIKGNVPVYV
jgi:predicted peroxiredoxin